MARIQPIRHPVEGPRIVPFGEPRLASDVLPNGRPAFRVTQNYDDVDWYWQQQGIIRLHLALDLGNQHCDDRVLSPFDGVAEPLRDRYGALGVQVTRPTDGLVAQMWHLGKVNIAHGQQVTRGQFVGRNGGTGLANGVCHVHFMVLVNGQPIDPWPLLAQNQDRKVALNRGNGINIRRGPGRPAGDMRPIFATARDGRLVRADGKDLGSATWPRKFGGFVRGAHHGLAPYPDEWARYQLAGAYRYVARPLVHIVRE